MLKRKKYRGHYCKICGKCKPNEKFSGKGHGKHICKSCQSLSAEVKEDLMRIRNIEQIMDHYPTSPHNWKLINKYALEFADKGSGKFAKEILDLRRWSLTPDEGEEKVPLAGEIWDLLQEFEDENGWENKIRGREFIIYNLLYFGFFLGTCLDAHHRLKNSSSRNGQGILEGLKKECG